jgi:hypothetical protein
VDIEDGLFCIADFQLHYDSCTAMPWIVEAAFLLTSLAREVDFVAKLAALSDRYVIYCSDNDDGERQDRNQN